MYLGPYIPEAWHVFMRQEKSGQEFIADTKKLCYFSLPFTNIQTLKIGETHSDPYFLDHKVEYIFLDNPTEVGVLAA